MEHPTPSAVCNSPVRIRIICSHVNVTPQSLIIVWPITIYKKYPYRKVIDIAINTHLFLHPLI